MLLSLYLDNTTSKYNIMNFIRSLDNNELINYVVKQLNNFFPDNKKVKLEEINKFIEETMERLFYCFGNIKLKYYFDGENVLFNHLNSDHYCMFLYLLSNTIFKMSNRHEELATKVFLLNKALHGIDVFYSVELPKVFLFTHPIGTILGHAKYGNNFCVFQGCSVGVASESGAYPEIGDNVLMYSNSKVLGKSTIGDNVIFGASAMIINTKVEQNKVIVGVYPKHSIIENERDDLKRIFR